MFTHFYTIAAVMVLAVVSFPQESLAFELEWDQTEAKVELKPGEKEAQARFVVTNKGEETVQIDRIKTSCGCTGSILDKKTIKPGESATIIGTFNKGNRPGLNRNRLQVFIKGQPEPAETLHMVVQVPRLIDIEPSIVYWNRSTSKTERQVRIKLNNMPGLVQVLLLTKKVLRSPASFPWLPLPLLNNRVQMRLRLLPRSSTVWNN